MANIYGPRCHDHGITGYGDPSHGVMFVGIHPADAEMEAKKPDQGQAGQLMNETLLSCGWNPDHTYHTNLLCYDTRDDSPQNIKECMPRLLSEIESFEPKLIVFFGALPATQFGIKRRGYLYPKKYPHPHWQMYTYHPAAVLHGNNDAIYDIVRDLTKIDLVMNHMDVPPIVRPTYTVIKSQQEAQYVLDHRLHRSASSSNSGLPLVALDIETRLHNPNDDELDVYDDDMRCLSISDGNDIYVFPRDTLDGLNWPSLQVIYHNGQFDTAGLRRNLGIELPIAEDTCLESYAGDEYAGSYNHPRKGQNKLETLVGEYFGDTEYKEETKKYWRKHIEPPDQDLYARNALDAHYTYHLHGILQQYRPPFKAYRDLLVPAANMFSQIIDRGAYIDQTAQAELRKEWGPRYAELILDIKEHVDNPRSWQQLSRYIYGSTEEGGLALPGGPSTAAKVLRTINNPFCQSVVELRELKYRMEHWIIGLKKHVKHDGRIHPDALLHGPETGRRAYHNPAVQTIPKHGEQQSRIRKLFSATTPDYVIIEADYAQIEVWVGAYLSGDDRLLADLESGDVHSATAARLGLDPTDKNMRQVGKTTNFLMQYGGGGGKLHTTLMERGIFVSEAFCHSVVEKWRHQYPGYAAFTEKLWKQIQEQGYIDTPFGRVRRCPLVTDPSSRASFINWPIQSTAGDYILTSFLELHEALRPYDSYILFDVHDSGVYEVNKKYLHEVAELIQTTMEAPRAGLPGVKIEMTVGPNLYEQRKYKVGVAA